MINRIYDEVGESIFTSVSRLARTHDAHNLGQGYPDFLPPEGLRNRLSERVETAASDHQYAPSPGAADLRVQISNLYRTLYGVEYDPETNITVTGGATEGLSSSLFGLLNEGDEVIVFEPVYDLYVPVARRAGAEVTVLSLREPEFYLPVERLRRVASPSTDLIIVNNPHNPTGRVFSREELTAVVEVARENDAVILSDEVYEQLSFPSYNHIPVSTIRDASQRTLTTGSVGKLFNATGWKVGWVLGPEDLTHAVRSAHQFSTYATATPLQVSLAEFIQQEDVEQFLEDNREHYERRRSILLGALRESVFQQIEPQGTYFVVAKVPGWILEANGGTLLDFVRTLIREHGLAAIPLSSFYVTRESEGSYLRFAFCKKRKSLRKAANVIRTLFQ